MIKEIITYSKKWLLMRILNVGLLVGDQETKPAEFWFVMMLSDIIDEAIAKNAIL
jgi:hypothetical protein